MASFSSFSSSSSTPPPPPSFSYISAPSSLKPFHDDSVEDSCSICLESFTVHDPSTRRQGSSGAGPSEVSGVQPTLTTSLAGSSSPITGLPSAADLHPEVARNISPETDVSYRPRVLYSPSPPHDGRKLNTSEVFPLPESIKSKLSAASARYKKSLKPDENVDEGSVHDTSEVRQEMNE
ncbi:unnamed protein product [Vicia faba]|uniref:Uncharacterized protein n=1 Tax=Vicia faba TaxID=3906 RepID=A0AAV0ZEB6_VICFA|nr:unnamed protein product [Vicia faba]